MVVRRRFSAPNDSSRALMAAAMGGMVRMFPYSLLPRPVHEAIARIVMQPSVLMGGRPFDELIAAAPAELELPRRRDHALRFLSTLADDMAIPRRPAVEAVVRAAAALLRAVGQLQRVPVIARGLEYAGGRILDGVLAKGLAGVAADHSTHVDRQHDEPAAQLQGAPSQQGRT